MGMHRRHRLLVNALERALERHGRAYRGDGQEHYDTHAEMVFDIFRFWPIAAHQMLSGFLIG